ncbi:hypothetical protein, partial [Teredinibacter waterburyi]|uniref:hypothetical protein n=1 Tax=Teredinibacter waterburyi TaxID=1500538 RepID=UPI00165F1DF5
MADVFILLFVLPLFLVIASLVSVYYFGVTAIWISSIFLGLAFTFMSNVTPGDLFSNNGSGASSKFPEILIPFIKGYILSALILFCAHLVFVAIRKYGIIPLVNNRYIFILAALVCAFWFWKLWSGMRIKSDYFLTEVTIYIPKDYPISLTNEMVFVGANGENARKIQISPVYSSQLESGQRNSSLKSRYENQFYEYKTNGKLLLPVDVAEFYLSWYSFTEEVYYSDSFALNGEKVKLIKPYSVAPNTQLRNSPLDFYIYPKGKSFL